MVDVYQLNFTHQNDLSKYQEETLLWCQSALDKLETRDINNLNEETVGEPSRSDIPDSQFSQSEVFQNLTDDKFTLLEVIRLTVLFKLVNFIVSVLHFTGRKCRPTN